MGKERQSGNKLFFFLHPTLDTHHEAIRREVGQMDFQRDFGAECLVLRCRLGRKSACEEVHEGFLVMGAEWEAAVDIREVGETVVPLTLKEPRVSPYLGL